MTGAQDSVGPASGQPIERLVQRAREGSLSAYAELVRRFEGRLFNFLLRRTPSACDAEELTQEAFLRAWENLDRYDPRWQFSTWLFTIARRAAVTASRRRRVVPDGGAAAAGAAAGGDHVERLSQGEQARLLWGLADRLLGDRQRSTLWLRYAEGLQIREIARIQGTTSLVVRVTLHRARRALARALDAADRAPAGGTGMERSRQYAGEPL